MISEDWNAKYPIGTPVKVAMDDGSVVETTTRSFASELPSGRTVIWLEGITGCYALDRVEPVGPTMRPLEEIRKTAALYEEKVIELRIQAREAYWRDQYSLGDIADAAADQLAGYAAALRWVLGEGELP